MVVMPRLFASCNGEAMRLELMVRHEQDGYDDERWFWVTIALPGDSGDRGGRGGKVFELEVLWLSWNSSPEFAVADGEVWPRTSPSIWSARRTMSMSGRCEGV
jgi:hypothetical protein